MDPKRNKLPNGYRKKVTYKMLDELLKDLRLQIVPNGLTIPRGTYNYTGNAVIGLLTGSYKSSHPIKRCSSAKAMAKFGRGVRDPKIKTTRRTRRSPK